MENCGETVDGIHGGDLPGRYSMIVSLFVAAGAISFPGQVIMRAPGREGGSDASSGLSSSRVLLIIVESRQGRGI